MELITQILAICGAISVVGGAVAVLSGWYKSWKAPKEKQDNRIEQIEKRITNIETSITGINQKLDNDYKNMAQTHPQRRIWLYKAVLRWGMDRLSREVRRSIPEEQRTYTG